MTLLLVLFAIGVTHLLPQLHSFKRWDGVLVWAHWVAGMPGFSRSPGGAVIVILLPIAVVAVAFFALSSTPILYFALALPVLIVTIGPGDLDRDVAHCIDAVCNQGGPQANRAVEKLVQECLHGECAGPRESLVDAVFAAAMQRWFAVLFWFIIAGPAGAVGYRLLRHLRDLQKEGEDLPRAWDHALMMACRAAQWPVAVLMMFALGVVASFDVVWHAWLDYSHRHMERLKALECGFLFAAVRDTFNLRAESDLLWRELADHHQGMPPGCLRLEQSMNLVWRLMFVKLTVLGLFTVLGWAR